MSCHRISQHWSAKKHAPPLPFVPPDPNRTRFSDIVAAVAEFYDVTEGGLRGPRKLRRIAVPRLMVYALARDLTRMSTTDIAYRLGRRDHTTVLYGVRRLIAQRDSDPILDEDYTALKARLTYRPSNDVEAA